MPRSRFHALPLTALLGAAPLLAAPAPAPPPAPLASPAEMAAAQAIDSELVACGTRHSLSSWTDPKRGAGCGRDVAVRQLQAAADRSGGRLKVVVDTFETSGARTRNVPVHMENVYAILPGNDPLLKSTAFVVSGAGR